MPAPERPPAEPSGGLYRLERGRFGDRLVAVEREDEATHVAISRFRERHATYRTLLAAAQAQSREQHEALRALDAEITASRRRLQEALAAVQQKETEAAARADEIRRLQEKNAAIIGEKRRLREMLSGRAAIPDLRQRIVIDYHSGEAFGLEVVPLDAAAGWEQNRAALAEARRLAHTYGARLREVRLDRVVWRAVIAVSIDNPPPLEHLCPR